jgi:hypothetical protein
MILPYLELCCALEPDFPEVLLKRHKRSSCSVKAFPASREGLDDATQALYRLIIGGENAANAKSPAERLIVKCRLAEAFRTTLASSDFFAFSGPTPPISLLR